MAPKSDKPRREHKYEYSPVTFSIETKGDIATPLIRRGTPLPSKRNQVFSTAKDNQQSVEINILLGERPLAKHNISIGKCLLKDIAPAKSGQPEIRVTFDVNKSCDLKVQALDTKSGRTIDAAFQSSQIKFTNALVQKLVSDAQQNEVRDDAELAIAEANLQVQADQDKNTVTPRTRKMEQLMAALGTALMEGAPLIEKTRELRFFLADDSTPSLPYGGFGDIFQTFFPSMSPVKQTKPFTQQSASQSQLHKPKESATPVSTPQTHTTALIQNFLEQVSPDLETKRSGAWQALESATQDGPAQAAYSMRELLSQLLDTLAPEADIQKAPWYKKPQKDPPVTRAMRIRYAMTGTSDVESESTLSLTNGMCEAVNSMYSKLSAQTHSQTRLKISEVRMYLNACEAIIGLIATVHKP